MKNKLLLLLIALSPLFITAQNKISLIGSVGYAWRTGKIASNLNKNERDLLKGLKSGMNYDLAGYYRLNNLVGLGLKYNLYTASNSGVLTVRDDYGYLQNIAVSADDKITFVGPSISYSNFLDDTKHKFYYDVALGVISYQSKLNNVTVKGSNVGLAGTIGYMYVVSPKIYIGPQISYTGGALRTLKVNGVSVELPEDQAESLHRFALGAGITVRL